MNTSLDPGSDKDRALRYISTHHVMSIATSGPDRPWNAAVFYVNEGFKLYFVSSPDSRHCLNFSRNANIAITIQEDYYAWDNIKGIQMEGIAEPVIKDRQQDIIELYVNKFPYLKDINQTPANIIAAIEKGVWYSVSPLVVFFIDNEKGFGYRARVYPD